MKPEQIVDARGGDYVIAEGSVLRGLLKSKITGLQKALSDLTTRVSNEIPSKEDAISLMMALYSSAPLNERALFFKACMERSAFLESEIKALLIIGSTFTPGTSYRILLSDAARYGLSD